MRFFLILISLAITWSVAAHYSETKWSYLVAFAVSLFTLKFLMFYPQKTKGPNATQSIADAELSRDD
ncbi:hypothetical protein [Curvivirga aplysinae]|uniref:hypothetical protein n=1 Tax=Curvivirga aplysinae TaxID=2529852 RepID=UPI0012BBD014|nr:hypothetical protein [Curvivirga aplysinae]MTI11280.1 hypothetical protein [Curvivirga aplysinae]